MTEIMECYNEPNQCINPTIPTEMKLLEQLPQPVCRLTAAIIAAGGRPVLVGGAVRDYLLGATPKDFDIESYGLEAKALSLAVERVAKVHSVGKCFGVFKAKVNGMEIDVTLPRREKKVGLGHRGFEVDYDPSMSFAEAASRRDFTINAIGIDLATGTLLDPWGGVIDLNAKRIRHVSDAFDEDPLRVLRACQFSARFGFQIAAETVEKCLSLRDELATLSTERIWEEFKKMLLKSPKPSVGLVAMEATGALGLFPELVRLRATDHNPASQTGGWEHSCLVLDVCVSIKKEDNLDDHESLVLMLAALCQNLGKPLTASHVDGFTHNQGAKKAEDAPLRSLLGRMGCPPFLIDRVAVLVHEHCQSYPLWRQSKDQWVEDGTIRRLALRVPIRTLCRLILANDRARKSTVDFEPCAKVTWLLERSNALGVLEHPPQPILQGRHLQGLGLSPGPLMGVLLREAFEAQLDAVFVDLPSAMVWAQTQIHTHTT